MIFLEPTPVITTPRPGRCPNQEWVDFGSNCYRVERLSRSFPEAKFDCNDRGGNVVSIGSQAEMEFITSIVDTSGFANSIWVGLQKNQATGRG